MTRLVLRLLAFYLLVVAGAFGWSALANENDTALRAWRSVSPATVAFGLGSQWGTTFTVEGEDMALPARFAAPEDLADANLLLVLVGSPSEAAQLPGIAGLISDPAQTFEEVVRDDVQTRIASSQLSLRLHPLPLVVRRTEVVVYPLHVLQGIDISCASEALTALFEFAPRDTLARFSTPCTES
ncbi:MAG: hypothetical protein AAGH73_10495 [Pseudomonadota bacterium]